MKRPLALACVTALATMAGCTPPSSTVAPSSAPGASTASDASATSPRLAALEREVREIIRRHAGDTAEVSVAFRDLRTAIRCWWTRTARCTRPAP
jgi:hypothetical protein